MAWIRLDDQIGHHPKFLKAGLSSWLWVCCIGFSQKFLTDGFIPDEAVSSVCGGVERPLLHFQKLVKVGLLDRVKDGYQVHDYLSFNDSAEIVKRKREEDKIRKQGKLIPAGIQPESERNPEILLARAPASHPIRSTSLVSNNKLATDAVATTTSKPNGNGGGPDARSKHPIFKGQRFVVFDWMLEDLMRMLGPLTNDFDLHEWFFALDASLATQAGVIPRNDVWPMLQNELLAEAHRRGLSIGTVKPPPLGKQTQRLLAMVAGMKDAI